MLKMKEPISLKVNKQLCTDKGVIFAERICANYENRNLKFVSEDLLHMLHMPSQIYIDDTSQISISNITEIENTNQQKLQFLNQVVNRILLSVEEKLTYQDNVFITNGLRKLGIYNWNTFMQQVHHLLADSKNTMKLTELYEKQEVLVKKILDQQVQEASVQTRYYMQNNIFKRLKTGEITREVASRLKPVSSLQRTLYPKEIEASESIRLANEIYLNQLREKTDGTYVPVYFERYQVPENKGQKITAENIRKEINFVMLREFIDHIFTVKYQLRKNRSVQWLDLKDAGYQGDGEAISRYFALKKEMRSTGGDNWDVLSENLEIQKKEIDFLKKIQERNTGKSYSVIEEQQIFEKIEQTIENIENGRTEPIAELQSFLTQKEKLQHKSKELTGKRETELKKILEVILGQKEALLQRDDESEKIQQAVVELEEQTKLLQDKQKHLSEKEYQETIKIIKNIILQKEDTAGFLSIKQSQKEAKLNQAILEFMDKDQVLQKEIQRNKEREIEIQKISETEYKKVESIAEKVAEKEELFYSILKQETEQIADKKTEKKYMELQKTWETFLYQFVNIETGEVRQKTEREKIRAVERVLAQKEILKEVIENSIKKEMQIDRKMEYSDLMKNLEVLETSVEEFYQKIQVMASEGKSAETGKNTSENTEEQIQQLQKLNKESKKNLMYQIDRKSALQDRREMLEEPQSILLKYLLHTTDLEWQKEENIKKYEAALSEESKQVFKKIQKIYENNENDPEKIENITRASELKFIQEMEQIRILQEFYQVQEENLHSKIGNQIMHYLMELGEADSDSVYYYAEIYTEGYKQTIQQTVHKLLAERKQELKQNPEEIIDMVREQNENSMEQEVFLQEMTQRTMQSKDVVKTVLTKLMQSEEAREYAALQMDKAKEIIEQGEKNTKQDAVFQETDVAETKGDKVLQILETELSLQMQQYLYQTAGIAEKLSKELAKVWLTYSHRCQVQLLENALEKQEIQNSISEYLEQKHGAAEVTAQIVQSMKEVYPSLQEDTLIHAVQYIKQLPQQKAVYQIMERNYIQNYLEMQEQIQIQKQNQQKQNTQGMELSKNIETLRMARVDIYRNQESLGEKKEQASHQIEVLEQSLNIDWNYKVERTDRRVPLHPTTLIHKQEEDAPISKKELENLRNEVKKVKLAAVEQKKKVEEQQETIIIQQHQKMEHRNIQEQEIRQILETTIHQQMGMISDRVYYQIESRLNEERKRRGY